MTTLSAKIDTLVGIGFEPEAAAALLAENVATKSGKKSCCSLTFIKMPFN